MGIIVEENTISVNEYFYSLQGEGEYNGCAAFFVRLAGCNVGCTWCDSKDSWMMSNGRIMTIDSICEEVISSGTSIVVITGGEPMMQNLDCLCGRLKQLGVRLHLETSGSEPFSGKFDWITLSPKRKKECREEFFHIANELKVVIECEDDFQRAENLRNKVNADCLLLLQTEWSVRECMMPQIIEYIKKNTVWRLSLQIHKFIGVE